MGNMSELNVEHSVLLAASGYGVLHVASEVFISSLVKAPSGWVVFSGLGI